MMSSVRLRRFIQPRLLDFGIRQISSATSTKLCSQLPSRSVLSVSGTDSKVFLNGIVASTIKDHPFYTTFLSAQGRVLYDVFIYPHILDGRPGYLIDYDNRSSDATPILALLKRHVLRSKVRIRDASNEWKVWSVWDSTSQGSSFPTVREWRTGRSGAVEPLYAEVEHQLGQEYPRDTVGTRDLRAPGMGDRLLVRAGDKPGVSCDVAQDETEFTLHRILHGVPEGRDDIVPQQAFPMDSNMDLMGGLDFRKGCYVGQELTVRTYHTGVVRKRIMPVSLTLAPSPKTIQNPLEPNHSVPTLPVQTSIQAERLAGASPTNPDRPTRPRGTGTLLSNVHGLGLALLRLEHVEGVERGELVMSFAQMGDKGTESWIVLPKRPVWWPVANNSTSV
ncbi:aminomethyltransferase [Rhizoctonia solani 123E]|uniref:Aminomethyltransferase n=1 Tax=Rhizoctonia solani 123E TaxID=1423351 RepID=A0A074SPZ3_9AGAM|nr:aminomethyltransferase [Rhizoctonia solani 123E]